MKSIESMKYSKYFEIKLLNTKDSEYRCTGRTTSLVLDCINSVYKSNNTDMYFRTIDEIKSFEQFVLDTFYILNCPVIKLSKFDKSIVFKVKVRNKETKLVLKVYTMFNENTYRGIYSRMIEVDHSLYLNGVHGC